MLTLWIVIIAAILFVIGAFVGLSYWYKMRDRNYEGDGGMMAFVCCLLAALSVIVTPIAAQQSYVLSIPPRLASLERTIEQQSELISIDATLGQGLEGIEIKREIQSTIRELNDLIAYAEYIAISP